MTSQWYAITFGADKPIDERECRLLVIDGRIAAQVAWPATELIGEPWAAVEQKIRDLGWEATRD